MTVRRRSRLRSARICVGGVTGAAGACLLAAARWFFGQKRGRNWESGRTEMKGQSDQTSRGLATPLARRSWSAVAPPEPKTSHSPRR